MHKRDHLLLVVNCTIREAHAHSSEAKGRYFQTTVP
jgi:hypothetical protein